MMRINAEDCLQGATLHNHQRKDKDREGNLKPQINNRTQTIKDAEYRGAWVAPSVKRPTLDFGAGHDLRVCEFEPHIGFCLLGILSPSLSAPTLLVLSLSQNKC